MSQDFILSIAAGVVGGIGVIGIIAGIILKMIIDKKNGCSQPGGGKQEVILECTEEVIAMLKTVTNKLNTVSNDSAMTRKIFDRRDETDTPIIYVHLRAIQTGIDTLAAEMAELAKQNKRVAEALENITVC